MLAVSYLFLFHYSWSCAYLPFQDMWSAAAMKRPAPLSMPGFLRPRDWLPTENGRAEWGLPRQLMLLVSLHLPRSSEAGGGRLTRGLFPITSSQIHCSNYIPHNERDYVSLGSPVSFGARSGGVLDRNNQELMLENMSEFWYECKYLHGRCVALFRYKSHFLNNLFLEPY